MARNFGRVICHPGGGRSGWAIDFGRGAKPRYLYSARGARLESREMAESILEAIRVAIARGADPQTAVDAFAPVTGERNTVEHWLGEYVERSTDRDELSPNTRRAIESHARLDIAPWWSTRSLTEIDAGTLDEWTRWLRKKRGLSAKSIRNALGVFHSFLRWLRRVGRVDQIPEFPNIHVPEHSPTIISPRTQALILGAIPHERRGAFLAL